MSELTAKDVRYTVESLRNTAGRPNYMQVALLHLREEFPDLAKPFADLPGETVIVLQKDKVPSVLVDSKGQILCFK